MFNVFVLYPSQKEAVDTLRTHFEAGKNFCVVKGLSGIGKSLVAENAQKDGFEAKVFDSRQYLTLDRIKQGFTKKMRLIGLCQTDNDVEYLHEQLGQMPDVVSLKALSKEDVQQWVDSVNPPLLAEEKNLIETYSLGVPLLLEGMLKKRPVTKLSASILCSSYLQGIINKNYLAHDKRNEGLRRIVEENTDFTVPQDIYTQLSDADFIVGKDRQPLSVLQSQLSEGKQMPTPETCEIFEIYKEWLQEHRDEPNFNLFIKEYKDGRKLIDDLGYVSHPADTALLENFSMAGPRKGAAFFAEQTRPFGERLNFLPSRGHGSDSYLHSAIMRVARASGVNAKLKYEKGHFEEIIDISVEQAPNAFFLHKHDHAPSDVMPVAYALECHLQGLGISYTIEYNGKTFVYDASARSYQKLETPKVDYYKEYRELLPPDEDGEVYEDELTE